MAEKIGGGIGGDDARGGGDQIPEEGCVGLLEMKDNGECVGCLDLVDHAEAAALRGFVGGIENEVESGFHVSGGERPAIVEFYVGLEVENVSERVGSLPGFGEVAVEIHLRVAGQKAGEDEAVEALRLAIGGKARFKVDVIGFDEEGERGGVEFCGARARREEAKKQRSNQKKKQISRSPTPTSQNLARRRPRFARNDDETAVRR